MKSVWRKHLIICLVLVLLAIPIYFLDRALLGGGGGGNWITLDFRGQTAAKRADVDCRALGIVVRRDVNLDVSGVGDGLAGGYTCTTNEDEKGD